jgi:hypothetical protein
MLAMGSKAVSACKQSCLQTGSAVCWWWGRRKSDYKNLIEVGHVKFLLFLDSKTLFL